VYALIANSEGGFDDAIRLADYTEPGAMTAADFDGDGLADLAVSGPQWGEGTASISVLRGSDLGQLTPGIWHGMGSSSCGVSLLDINGDGHEDLVSTECYGGRSGLYVALGREDGTWEPSVWTQVRGDLSPAAFGDVDGDGFLDAVITHSQLHRISVLPGNGDGTFGAASQVRTRQYPDSATLGDFNRDGAIDVIVSVEPGLSLMPGSGDGGFGAPTSIPNVSRPNSVLAEDFNRDGLLDLALTSWDTRSVSLLFGQGDGSFGPPTAYGTGQGPSQVMVDDLNGDDLLDIVVTNSSSSDISVLLGRPEGTFAEEVRYVAGRGPRVAISGDFDGDGTIDLAVRNSDSQDVSILFGTGQGGFEGQQRYEAAGWGYSLIAGDVDGDGDLDLVFGGNGVRVLPGQGDGSFGVRHRVYIGDGASQVIAVDMDGDGHLDLVASEGTGGFYFDDSRVRPGGGVAIALGHGNGQFDPATVHYLPKSNFSDVAAADLDGDQAPDLALVNAEGIWILTNAGWESAAEQAGDANRDGQFNQLDIVQVLQAGKYHSGEPASWEQGDFNRDGLFDRLDIVTALQTGSYAVGADLYPDVLAAELMRSADGTYRVSVTLSSPYDTPRRYADAWRVLGPDGTVLGVRILTHDHQFEQPFTRSLSGVVIPSDVTELIIEGRDQISGWGGTTIRVNVPR
jgi:hypothetical protein